MKQYLLIILSFFLTVTLVAQVGEIQGKVTDPDLKEGLPFATVSVTVNGSLVGAQTDFDGVYSIKPLPPGRYDVTVQYIGYQTSLTKDVIVEPDKITFLDIDLAGESEMLEEIVVKEYKVPLLKADETSVGNTVTKEQIQNLPTRDVSSIASTTAGVYQEDEGGDLNVKGSRSNATDYYVDGIKVRGSTAIPAQAIEQMTVVTGGVPARYGDATGGIINITTRGPSNSFAGGVEVLTSQFLDPYNYNLFTGSITGPILKKGKGTDQERVLLGFFASGEYVYEKDDDPSHFGVPKLKDDVRDELIQNPLRYNPDAGGIQKNIDFLQEDDFEILDARENIDKNAINGTVKLEFQPVSNLNFTIGGTANWRTGGLATRSGGFRSFLRRYEPFGTDRIPEFTEETYRGFVRFTQRFGGLKKLAEGEKQEANTSLLSNAYYSIQFDYTKDKLLREDPLHRDDLFGFGYLGAFDIDRNPIYSLSPLVLEDENGVELPLVGVDKNLLNLQGQVFEGFGPSGVGYTPGGNNEVGLAHNAQFYDLIGNEADLFRTLDDIDARNGLINGYAFGRPDLYSSYNIFYVPGLGTGTRLNQNNDQYRLSFNGSVDLKKPGASERNKHAIEFGFEYEQRVDREYSISANGLWDRMRRQINNPLTGGIQRDLSNPYLIINGERVSLLDYSETENGTFNVNDTIDYDFIRTSQTYFDEKFRELFGYEDINEHPFVNTDDISVEDLDKLSLDLFSAEDLFGSGTSGDNLVGYHGYDYRGNILTDQPAFEDFFKRDEDGYLEAKIGAYRPVYMAGYIQDKFSFKDLIFNVGVRVDRFDANQKVMKDLYSLYGTRKVQDVSSIGGDDVSHPESIGDDYVVYVDDEVNPTKITGYRSGDDWFNAEGTFVNNPNILAEDGFPVPYLSDPLDNNPKDDVKQEGFVDILNTAFEDYTPQISVMPRIAFSFNISDEATFFANYSVLTQRPQQRNDAYADQYYFFSELATTGIINNPNLKPEKTIAYQLGFKQKVSRTSAITISGFYREMRDMIQVIRVPIAYPVPSYNTLGNIDFGTVKGLEFSYDLRRTGNIQLLANYTLQFSDGTGSDALGAENQVNAGQGNLRTIRPLSFDSRHGINLSIDYRYGGGSKYDGPRIKDLALFANTGANLIIRSRSGTPYSRQSIPTPRGQFGVASRAQLEGQVNGSRLPWNSRVDLNFDRDITLNPNKEKGKKEYIVNIYLQIQNVLNTRNLLTAYAATGSGENDGYLNSAVGAQDAASQINPETFALLYGYKILDPNNFNIPRRIRLGASFSF